MATKAELERANKALTEAVAALQHQVHALIPPEISPEAPHHIRLAQLAEIAVDRTQKLTLAQQALQDAAALEKDIDIAFAMCRQEDLDVTGEECVSNLVQTLLVNRRMLIGERDALRHRAHPPADLTSEAAGTT